MIIPRVSLETVHMNLFPQYCSASQAETRKCISLAVDGNMQSTHMSHAPVSTRISERVLSHAEPPPTVNRGESSRLISLQVVTKLVSCCDVVVLSLVRSDSWRAIKMHRYMIT
jgi:hypothetical protein